MELTRPVVCYRVCLAGALIPLKRVDSEHGREDYAAACARADQPARSGERALVLAVYSKRSFSSAVVYAVGAEQLATADATRPLFHLPPRRSRPSPLAARLA